MKQKKTVISLERMLPSAEVTEMTQEGRKERREIRSGGSSNTNTIKASKSRSESETKRSRPGNTGRPMSLRKLKKSASDRRESSNITGVSKNSTSIS